MPRRPNTTACEQPFPKAAVSMRGPASVQRATFRLRCGTRPASRATFACLAFEVRAGSHRAFFAAAFFAGVCDSTEAAADFAAGVTRPSRNTWEAFVASLDVVAFIGSTCESALAATDFGPFPLAALSRSFAAVVATFGLVDL